MISDIALSLITTRPRPVLVTSNPFVPPALFSTYRSSLLFCGVPSWFNSSRIISGSMSCILAPSSIVSSCAPKHAPQPIPCTSNTARARLSLDNILDRHLLSEDAHALPQHTIPPNPSRMYCTLPLARCAPLRRARIVPLQTYPVLVHTTALVVARVHMGCL